MVFMTAHTDLHRVVLHTCALCKRTVFQTDLPFLFVREEGDELSSAHLLLNGAICNPPLHLLASLLKPLSCISVWMIKKFEIIATQILLPDFTFVSRFSFSTFH